ncbi:MAG: hypothetical protein LBL90_14235 [Prevotellaceae bacterium]|jgi:hypothetical protein|nr:hypothetical protein [Prevotellaceae bacterium]
MKVKIIENTQVNFHPTQQLNREDLNKLNGGLCNVNSFNINGSCVCDVNCFLRLGKKKAKPTTALPTTDDEYGYYDDFE